MAKVPNIKLNNNLNIPALGLGTWQGPPGKEAEVLEALKYAIDIGYRHFDCAYIYGYEATIGEAIRQKIQEGVVKREDLFITSKLWCTFFRPALVEKMLKDTLERFRLDYLDLYLLHWPFALKEGETMMPTDPETKEWIPSDVDYIDTWKAMEEVQKKGLTKSIGISNFNSLQVERVLKHCVVKPVVNQVECHIYLNQKRLRKFCMERGIILTSYSPLGSPARPFRQEGDVEVLDDEKIKEIAEKYGKTSAQILLRFNIQLGNSVIPKSSNKQRLKENIDVFDFELSTEEMKFLEGLDCNGRIVVIKPAMNLEHYPFKSHLEF